MLALNTVLLLMAGPGLITSATAILQVRRALLTLAFAGAKLAGVVIPLGANLVK